MTEKRIFTYEEALGTFPLVQRLTREAVQQVESLFRQVGAGGDLEVRHAELEGATQSIVDAWASQVEGLGCEVKGLWLVDFDSGAGYYCWRYPEESLAHYHGYDEGFAGRVPIH
ncbi:MAG TPA: DUF2203 domain-containing protein [Thermoanaerobaculia bacterium]|nr:DUF2203 domain-containing protein [Thermoanaerobaculia bacterium]